MNILNVDPSYKEAYISNYTFNHIDNLNFTAQIVVLHDEVLTVNNLLQTKGLIDSNIELVVDATQLNTDTSQPLNKYRYSSTFRVLTSDKNMINRFNNLFSARTSGSNRTIQYRIIS